jgi:hypothetical protein
MISAADVDARVGAAAGVLAFTLLLVRWACHARNGRRDGLIVVSGLGVGKQHGSY